jgi:hypothetical protein
LENNWGETRISAARAAGIESDGGNMSKRTKMTMTQFRQGDVFLMRIDESEVDRNRYRQDSIDGRPVVLALGEVTGHAHQFRDPGVCMLVAEGISDRVVMITALGGADLVHEEHGTIRVPPGAYRVRIQCEYDPNTMARQVQD